MQRFIFAVYCALAFPLICASSSSAASIDGLPSNYVPGTPLSFLVRLPAISNLGAYNVDVVVESSQGTAGVDFYFDAVATLPAATNYVFSTSANFFDAANADSSARHRITLTDFDFIGADVTPGVNDRVASVVLQTAATFGGSLSLFVDADGLLLDTPATTPTPVDGFDAIQAAVAANGAVVLEPVPEPSSVVLLLSAAIVCRRRRRTG